MDPPDHRCGRVSTAILLVLVRAPQFHAVGKAWRSITFGSTSRFLSVPAWVSREAKPRALYCVLSTLAAYMHPTKVPGRRGVRTKHRYHQPGQIDHEQPSPPQAVAVVRLYKILSAPLRCSYSSQVISKGLPHVLSL